MVKIKITLVLLFITLGISSNMSAMAPAAQQEEVSIVGLLKRGCKDLWTWLDKVAEEEDRIDRESLDKLFRKQEKDSNHTPSGSKENTVPSKQK